MTNPLQGRKWLVILGLLVTLIAILGYRAMTHEAPGDFARYYTAGGVIADGDAPQLYEKMSVLGRFEHSFRYLPIFAILMAPLSMLPVEGAYWIWQILHYACYFTWLGASYLILRRAGIRWTWMLLPAACTIRICMQNFQLGQINPIMIALTLAGVYQWYRKRSFTAGALIGLGAAIKFTPVLFFPVFLASRQWRAAGGMLFSAVFFVILVPSVVIGPKLNVDLIREYISQESGLLTPHDRERVITGQDRPVAGQSLKALLTRYLTHSNAVHQAKHNDPIYVNIVDIDPVIVHTLYGLFALALFIPVLVMAHRTRGSTHYVAVLGSITVICMLLLSPESRRAHFGIMILPYMLLTFEAIAPFFRERRMKIAAILAMLAMATIALPSRGLVGKPAANWIDAHGNMGFAALALYAAVFVVYRELRRNQSGRNERETAVS